MSGSETLADWLRRQLDEDQRIAEAAVGHQVSVDVEWGSHAVLHHIHRWSSARVLREVQVKRELLDREVMFDPHGQPQCQGHPGPWMNHGEHGPGNCRDYSDNWTLRLLAQPYRGVDGWREEWAIEN